MNYGSELQEHFKKAYARHQWVIIDAKVYDLSKFKNLHPGGGSVLLDPEVGEDCDFKLSMSALLSPQLDKMPLKPFSAFTATRFLKDRNIKDSR